MDDTNPSVGAVTLDDRVDESAVREEDAVTNLHGLLLRDHVAAEEHESLRALLELDSVS